MLSGINVGLGVTGSVAAVEVVEIAHELRRRGATVKGVMTDSASNIVHPWTVEFATDQEVCTEITGATEHIELFGTDGWADVFLVAPATANTIGKMAGAIDDTPVTTSATTALGAGIPIVVAPAMHRPMYDHPGVLSAIDTLQEWDVTVVDPRFEEGKAKIADVDTIVLDTARAVGAQPLAGNTVIVTSGATAEPIDPVRVLSNRASGKTGRAVARGLYALGADVILVHDGPDVPYADVETVRTASDMREAVLSNLGSADALVSAAAISDYTVEQAEEKIRSGQELTLHLEPTPKLLEAVRDRDPDLPIVGFKVETGPESSMIDRARDLQDRYGLAFVVANDVSVMGEKETSVRFVDGESADEFTGSKADLGLRVAEELAERIVYR
ncbi:MAG: bifunctional phosphopantothenoylcysteine decarboxylase/phosphopantothenate--cysteine ligase CoaBC [Halodesulfurarchaeum sp.]